MTQEETNLLIRDICGRLPDGIFVKDKVNEKSIYTSYYHPYIDNCKPYLRPMESMTEEERIECRNTCISVDFGGRVEYFPTIGTYDFYNKKYLDYRLLIEKGLAIKAPIDMYKTKQ